jgi:hypothetical protein
MTGLPPAAHPPAGGVSGAEKAEVLLLPTASCLLPDKYLPIPQILSKFDLQLLIGKQISNISVLLYEPLKTKPYENQSGIVLCSSILFTGCDLFKDAAEITISTNLTADIPVVVAVESRLILSQKATAVNFSELQRFVQIILILRIISTRSGRWT